MRIDPDTDILGLVDVQPTFMPGGELAVAEGDAILPAIATLLPRFAHAFATQDWHPPGHSSFASAHPGKAPFDTVELSYGSQTLWPDHGIAGSANAAIHPAVRFPRRWPTTPRWPMTSSNFCGRHLRARATYDMWVGSAFPTATRRSCGTTQYRVSAAAFRP